MANVKMSDMRAVGYCRRGVKVFLESHGFDWKTFINEGVPEELLAATDDAQALKVVDYVRQQNGQQQSS
jgi:hypothetical protein